MSSNVYDKLEAFINLLSEDADEADDDIDSELKECGIDVSAVSARVYKMVEWAEDRCEPEWLVSARKEQEHFNNALEDNSDVEVDDCSKEELLAAISSGKYGNNVQCHAQIFFRNRNENDVTKDELISLVKDCMLLNKLEKKRQ